MKKTNLGTVVKTEEGEILEDDADDPKVDVPSLYQVTRSLGKEIVLDFEHSAIHLTSPERDLQIALMESRSLRGDIYGSLFQQSRSVERRGQSSFAGHNAANTNLFQQWQARSESQRVLPSSTRSQRTSKRNVRRRSVRPISNEIPESSFARARNTQFSTHGEVRGNKSSSYKDLGDCNQCCVHWGALFWNFELPTILEPGKLAKVDKDAILVDDARELAVDP
uniref:Uncharacterized protein n=1 Tax=Tanacetum cinerariifolium TaxID=118510 RepID=A0A6L2KR82_TANCI|nr:hypothetical protein [Tanacetum cinerariifolium]